jgi:hypothetical protein
VINKCHLAKKIFEIERGNNNLCWNLLRNKYLRESGTFSDKKKNNSQFWKGLMLVREDVARGLIYIVGNGNKIRFWLDT